MSNRNHVLVITTDDDEPQRIDDYSLSIKHATPDLAGNVMIANLDSFSTYGVSVDGFISDGILLDAVYATETAKTHELYESVLAAAYRSYAKNHPKVKLEQVI